MIETFFQKVKLILTPISIHHYVYNFKQKKDLNKKYIYINSQVVAGNKSNIDFSREF